ncbi:hypothetical protein [Streptomyces mayteni]
MSDGEALDDPISQLNEDISLAVSGLGGAMMGIADSYMELAYGAGRGYGVHADYRKNNLITGMPVTELARELSEWAAEILAMAKALDAQRAALKKLEAEG